MEENRKRHEIINAPYNPVTGLGAVGERKKISIKDSPIGDMYLPVELIKENLFIRRLAKYGFKGYIIRFIKEVEYSEEALNQLWIEFIKYRIILIRKSDLDTKINLILALKKTNMILMPKR